MTSNQKLTHLIKGRTIQGSEDESLKGLFAILGRLDHASEDYGIK
jgi:hypothetical protein